MRKILITGGAGNLGSSLARRLTQDSNTFVHILDNLLTGKLKNLPAETKPNWTFKQVDVNQYSELAEEMRHHQFDYVFHYAAVVGVERTLQNPMLVLKDLDGLKNILSLSKETGVKRIFYSSSSEVYGEPTELPLHEEDTPLNSRLPYAVVKNTGEIFFKAYFQEYGLPYTIFRFFNTYGPRQSKDFVIAKFLSQALAGQDITIYGKGDQTRTFCYVDDNLDTIEAILNKKLHENDIINIGCAREMTILELAHIIKEVTQSKSNITFLPPLEEGDMSRRQPDISKMLNVLNRPLLNIYDGLAKTIEISSTQSNSN